MANSDSAKPQNHKIDELSEEVSLKIGYNRGKRWSDDENNVLRSLLDSKSWKDIDWKDIRNEEKLFGRDLKAIQDKARRFFKKERQEKEFMESQELSEEVNSKIGYNNGKLWLDDEINVLKSILNANSRKEIRDLERYWEALQVKERKFFREERQEKELMQGKAMKSLKNLIEETVYAAIACDFDLIEETVANAFATGLTKIKNTFHDLKVGSTAQGKKVKKVAGNFELPWELLDIISKTLDFEDLFQFASACKNWRDFYWRNLLASQEPLLLQVSYNHKETYSFISLPDQKIYCLKMMKYFVRSIYVTSSSGYFIMAGYNNSFILINPFTRIEKVVNVSTFEVESNMFDNHALLAFGKCSEEFVLVILCKSSRSLRVYQSQNCGWVTYSTMENSGRVVDFMVLHNIIYVVTDKANIGVLSLNSAAIKFLKLKNVPNVTTSQFLRLVNCDEQLLVVDSSLKEIRNVYKIDFSTMNYVKLDTLGDISLFYAANRNCYALSNPNKWGYESNSVYVINRPYTQCSVYSGDDKKLQKCITLPASPHTGPFRTESHMLDWCFRHLRYEVDYSLVE